MNLGNKLKALRLKAGVTQDKMAQELGVSCQAVSKCGEGETEDYRQNPEQEGSVIKGSMQWNK